MFDFLFPYQKEGVKHLMRGKKLLADGVGLGKSVQALTYAESKPNRRVLIVCPSPLKFQWKQEIKKFFNIDSTILEGTPKKRLKAFNSYKDSKTKYLIVNYEQLIGKEDKKTKIVTLKNKYLELIKFDLIIFDEVHKIKNYKSGIHKGAKKIKTLDKIGLTATPLINNPMELFTLINFLKPWFFNYKFFTNTFCSMNDVYTSFGRKRVIDGYKNLDKLNHYLKPIMIRRLKDEVFADLPKRSYKTYMVDLLPEQKRLHNIYFGNAKDSFDSGCNKYDYLAFLQLARGVCDSTELLYLSESKKALPIKKIESGKLEVLKKIDEDIPDKIIIFTLFSKMAKIIYKELGKDRCVLVTGEDKNKHDSVQEFKNNPKKKYLCTSDCINYGFNIEEAHILIHFDKPWTQAMVEQREGRIDRLTQKNKMLIIDLITKDSIEEKVEKIIAKKKNMIDKIIDGNVNTQISQDKLINELLKDV